MGMKLGWRRLDGNYGRPDYTPYQILSKPTRRFSTLQTGPENNKRDTLTHVVQWVYRPLFPPFIYCICMSRLRVVRLESLDCGFLPRLNPQLLSDPRSPAEIYGSDHRRELRTIFGISWPKWGIYDISRDEVYQ